MLNAFAIIAAVGSVSVYLSDAGSNSVWHYFVFPALAFACALALFYWFLMFVARIRLQRILLRNETLKKDLIDDNLSKPVRRT